MECLHHKGEKILMTCITCAKYPLLCALCIEEQHEAHKLQSLRNAADAIRDRLVKAESDNSRLFSDVKSDLQCFEEIKDNANKQAQSLVNQAEEQCKMLQGLIEKTKGSFLERHKTIVDKDNEAIDKVEKKVRRKLTQIENFQENVAKLQKMNSYIDIITLGRDVDIPDVRKIPMPDGHSVSFKPGTGNEGDIEKMFGVLQLSNDNQESGDVTESGETAQTSDFVGSITNESRIHVSVVGAFNKSERAIVGIYSYTPGHCWLKYEDKNSIQLVNESGHVMKHVNLGTKTGGCAMTSDHKLLFCCTKEKCIREMSLPEGGQANITFSSGKFIPNYICSSPSGDVIVTIMDKCSYNITEKSVRGFFACRNNKEEIGIIRNVFQHGEKLLVLPLKVSINSSNTTIAVINQICPSRTELILVDREWKPFLRYGGPNDQLQRLVMITDLTFDDNDNILIAEGYSRTVQLLSPSLELLKVLLTLEDAPPCSIALNGDNVWVGDSRGKVHIIKYIFQ